MTGYWPEGVPHRLDYPQATVADLAADLASIPASQLAAMKLIEEGRDELLLVLPALYRLIHRERSAAAVSAAEMA